jgi:hypothetical protein
MPSPATGAVQLPVKLPRRYLNFQFPYWEKYPYIGLGAARMNEVPLEFFYCLDHAVKQFVESKPRGLI